MPNFKDKYATIVSSSYTDNIHIPLQFQRNCVSLSLRNNSTTIPVSITINGVVTPAPVSSTLVDLYEKDGFTQLDIDTELGHDFILEVYRG